MQHLRSENQNLLEIVETMRNEMTSIRYVHSITVLIFPHIIMELIIFGEVGDL